MHAVTLGPLIFAADRFAAIAAAGVFYLIASLLSRRLDRRLEAWAGYAMLAGLITARAGHVLLNASSFADEPWRALAIWQGGFSIPAAAVGIALASALFAVNARFLAGAGAALMAGSLVGVSVLQLTRATYGQAAPETRMHSLSGETVSLSAFTGSPMVINLWASWCPPCRREMPMLAKVAAERSEVSFIFVNQGESIPTIARYLARDRLTLSNVLLDRTMALPRHYGTPGLPVTLFLRADGTLASLHIGEISREALLAGIAGLFAGEF